MTALNQDDFFTRVFEQGLSDPDSKLYLPGMIMASTNPPLNPYVVKKLDLGNQTLGPGFTMDVLLTNLNVLGLANVSINPAQQGSFVLSGLLTNFCAQLGKLNPPPTGVAAEFEMDADFTLSDGTGDSSSGTLTIKLDQVSISGQFTIGGEDLGDINMQLNNLSVAVPDDVTISVTVHFSSGASGFNTMMERFLEQVSVIRGLLSGVNKKVNDSLPQISSSLSQIVQADLKQQLGM